MTARVYSEVQYLPDEPRFAEDYLDATEERMVGRLAGAVHTNGMRFDGWPVVELLHDDAWGYQRLVATVTAVPR